MSAVPGKFKDHGGDPDGFRSILTDNWDYILRTAKKIGGAESAPNLSKPDIGCGHYGCVFETGIQNMAAKLTFDVTEAEFAAWLIQHCSTCDLDGVARFYGSCSLPRVYKGLRPYMIWRELLQIIGLRESLSALDVNDYERIFAACTSAWQGMLHVDLAYKETGGAFNLGWLSVVRPDEAKDRLRGAHATVVRSVERVTRIIERCLVALTELSDVNPCMRKLGESLSRLAGMGVFCVDIHVENMGLPFGRDYLVLSDPGRVISIEPFDAPGRC